MISISVRARGSALNHSACVQLVVSRVGNFGIVPNSRREGTSPLGLIVSFIDSNAIRGVVLLCRYWWAVQIILNIHLNGCR